MNDWTSKRRMAPEKMITMAKRVMQSLAFVNISKDDGDNGHHNSTCYLISLMNTVTDKSYPKIELATEDDPENVINILELDGLTEIAFTDDTLMWTDLETRERTTVTFPLKTSCKKFLETLDEHRPDIFFRKGTEKGWPPVRNQEPESIAQPAFPADYINAEGQEIETSGQFKKEILDFLGQNEFILSRAVLSDESFWKEFIDTIPQLRIRFIAIIRSIFFNNILPVVWRSKLIKSQRRVILTDEQIEVSKSAAESQIHVEQLWVTSDTMNSMAALLPFFKPILWSIEFWSRNYDKKSLEQIMKMDHWKNARELCFRYLPDWFPIENLFHCPSFSVAGMDITTERLVKIRDILFKSPTFESCMLSFRSDEPDPYFLLLDEDEKIDYDFHQLRQTVSRVMRAHPAYNVQNRRYRIDGNDSYFQLKISKDDSVTLHIENKTL